MKARAIATTGTRSPFMITEEVVDYGRFPSKGSFYMWRMRNPHRLPAVKRGRLLLFRRVDVELAFESETAYVEAFQQRSGLQGTATRRRQKVVAITGDGDATLDTLYESIHQELQPETKRACRRGQRQQAHVPQP